MRRWLHFAGCYVLPTSLVVWVAWCISLPTKMAAPPEIVVLTPDQIQEKVCTAVVQIAESSIKDHGFFSVGVSGGSLAKVLCLGLKSRPGIGEPTTILHQLQWNHLLNTHETQGLSHLGVPHYSALLRCITYTVLVLYPRLYLMIPHAHTLDSGTSTLFSQNAACPGRFEWGRSL